MTSTGFDSYAAEGPGAKVAAVILLWIAVAMELFPMIYRRGGGKETFC